MRASFLILALLVADVETAYANVLSRHPLACERVLRNTFDSLQANEDGLVAWSPLTMGNILDAYRAGAFPWTHMDGFTGWYSIDPRGILDFSDFHVPDSLRNVKNKLVKEGRYRFAVDENFRAVMQACAEAKRANQSPGEKSWITPEMIERYTELNKIGFAHSFEVYIDGKLAGGTYGVFIDGAFSGDSMFHKVSNAGKLALWGTINYLRSRGLTWIDTQTVTKATEPFGAKLISRKAFLHRLEKAHHSNLTFD